MKSLNKIIAVFAAVAALVSCGKEEPGEDPSEALKKLQHEKFIFKFDLDPIVVNIGEETPLKLGVRRGDEATFHDYDWAKDEAGARLSVSEPDVLSVTADHKLKGLKSGAYTTLTVMGTNNSTASVKVKVEDPSTLVNPAAAFTAENVALKKVTPAAGIQCFDIDSKGNAYIIGSKTPYLYVEKFSPSGASLGIMKLTFFGHGTSCAIEEASDGTYIWVPSFASQDAAATYKGDRMISRLKFEAGRTWSTDDEYVQQNSWFIGDYTALCPSIDFEAGLLGIAYASDHADAGFDAKGKWVVVYKLADVKNAPRSEITLRQITRGGEAGGPVPAVETIYMRVRPHDLRGVTPVGKFSYTTKEAYGYDFAGTSIRAMQGFCIGRGKAFFLAGYGPNRDTDYSAYTFDGKLDTSLCHFKGVDDVANLKALELTESSYEAEGIQVRGGRMYVGFGGKIGGKSYASIIRMPK